VVVAAALRRSAFSHEFNEIERTMAVSSDHCAHFISQMQKNQLIDPD